MRVRADIREIALGGIPPRAGRAQARAVEQMTLAAIADTRPYVPRLSGDLVASGESESQPQRGLVIYGSSAVPYARAQYYGLPNKTGSFHPKATSEWFVHSKAANKGRWERVAKSEYRKEF